ncbi:MAG: hypothetical protein RR547_11050 [Raoultibacter sp.]
MDLEPSFNEGSPYRGGIFLRSGISEEYELRYLSCKFYSDFPHDLFPEILYKNSRPYAVFLVLIHGVKWAVPFRSHINHSYCFRTCPPKKCGIDYSKGVVIADDSYLEIDIDVVVNQAEFNNLKGNQKLVLKGFRNYLKSYKKAKGSMHIDRSRTLVENSSLQYFEESFIDKV